MTCALIKPAIGKLNPKFLFHHGNSSGKFETERVITLRIWVIGIKRALFLPQAGVTRDLRPGTAMEVRRCVRSSQCRLIRGSKFLANYQIRQDFFTAFNWMPT